VRPCPHGHSSKDPERFGSVKTHLSFPSLGIQS
jgi:hypothetical protein